LSRTLLTIILLYILIFNPDILRITLIGYSAEEKFEDKPYFLWVYRGMDIVIQAFMLFAAAISIAALFRSEEPEEGVEKSG